MSDTILILGLGSIGQRHARNALALGYEVLGFDPDAERAVLDFVSRVDSPMEGFQRRPAAVLVCSPPEFHALQAVASLRSSIPTFVEKPMALGIADARRILAAALEAHVPMAVGHQLRAVRSLQVLRACLWSEDRTPYAAHAEFAYSLEKWRPAPASYMAGILSEAVHELDLLAWMLGEPASVFCETRSLRGEGPEDLAALLVRWPWGTVATVHLDMLAPEYRRRLVLYERDRVSEWEYSLDEGDCAYMIELKAFLEGKPLCGPDEGYLSVLMLEAARESAKSGRWEKVRP